MSTNYSMPTGADFVLSFAVKASGGSAQNIAGWTFFCTLKTSMALADNATTGVTKVSGVITSEAGGVFTVTLPSATTANLSGTYYYDVKYVDNAGVKNVLLSGVITFTPAITIRSS